MSVICVLSSIQAFPQKVALDSVSKPDLLIERVLVDRLPSMTYDHYGNPIGLGPWFKFNLRILNIGNTFLAKPFYISFSTTQKDFQDRYCDHTSIVNQQADTIFVGSYIDVEVEALIEPQTSSVFFVIDTNNLCGRTSHLPHIDESNYDNNWFDFQMKKSH
jgi:hypothetical protein